MKATTAQTASAQSAFSATFRAIKSYLLNPTMDHQLQMYKRVDAGLFEFYSFEGGALNSNKGRVAGSFALTYRDGTQCYDRSSRLVSFQVIVRARFHSTNRRSLVFKRLAHVQIKPPKIEHYVDPVTR